MSKSTPANLQDFANDADESDDDCLCDSDLTDLSCFEHFEVNQ